MKIIVVGLGSMGKRRIRLIKRINSEAVVIGVDRREDRREEVKALYGVDTFLSIEEALGVHRDVICALVCTAPLSHNVVINECLRNGLHVFTEINLVSDGYKANMDLAEKKGLKLFLSSTFLYREEIRYIDKEVKKNKNKVNYIYHIGQYLPDWHPWESYKDFFVSNKRTNGCREIMAIELPWIIEVFGEIIDCKVVSNNISDLQIDYSDNYIIQTIHNNGNKGVLIVDIVNPRAGREFVVYGEHFNIRWNGTPQSLTKYQKGEDVNIKLYDIIDKIENYSSFVIENAYESELEEFFEVINTSKKQRYGFEKDLKVLQLIDEIEGIR